MADDLRERVNKLPAWIRQHIAALESLPARRDEELKGLRADVVRLTASNRKLRDKVEAMTELFQCAGKGGSELGVAVARVVDEYLTPGED